MLDFLIPLISAAAGLGGVFLGGWLTNLREREKRRTDHIERQLSEFYGPLMTYRKQLAARREHRQNIERAINRNWERLAPEIRKGGIETRNIAQVLTSQLDALSEDDKKYLEEVLLPDFHGMVRLFREKMWLAEPSTLPHFGAIVEYVDAWDLFLRKVVTGAVAIELQRATDAKLTQFYTDLEATHDRLRRELTDIQSRKGWSAIVASARQRWLVPLLGSRRAGR